MKSIHLLQLAVFAAGLGLVAPAAHAEDKTDCSLTYTRTACAGQEAESYKKCDGKQSCTKSVAAADEAACQTAAVEACANDRPSVTKSKVITATYKGKPVKSKGGKPDLCQDYAKRAAEFNQCEKK